MLALVETLIFSLVGKQSSKTKSIIGHDFFVLLEYDDQHVTDVNVEEFIQLIEKAFDTALKRDLNFLHALPLITGLLSITVGFVDGSILYLRNIGTGEVLLQRNGKTGVILSSGNVVSGHVAVNDSILVSNHSVLTSTSHDVRCNLLAKLKNDRREDVADTIEFLTGVSHGLFIVFGEKIESQPHVPPPKSPRMHLSKQILVEKLKNIWMAIQDKQERNIDPIVLRKKRMVLSIAVVLTILLIVSIFLNIDKASSVKRQQRLTQALTLVSHQYDEAVSLLDLNPVRSRTLLSDSKLALSPLLKEFPKKTKEYEQVNEWLAKISAKELAAYKIYKLTSIPLYFDIAFIKTDGVGSKIAGFEENKIILDEKNSVLYSFDSKTKKAEIIAGKDTLKNANAVTVHGNIAYVVNEDGVVAVNIDTKTATLVIKKEEKWGDIGASAAFGGNVYLLDRSQNSIWKYISQDVGFLPPDNYVNKGVPVNFSEAHDLAIDGSIWVVSTGGDILRLTRGSFDPFAMKEFSDTTSGIEDISTTDSDTFVYFLDKQMSRILVFDKDGVYQSQYQWDDLKNANDFIVSEIEKKIFVLIASKVYAIDLP